VDFGARRAEAKNYDLGINYPLVTLLQNAINDGSYNFLNPSQNPASVINGFVSRISRVSTTRLEEVYAVSNTDLFEMGGGMAAIAFGGEWRRDFYEDNYDSLSEAGVIGGSAGSSAGGSRNGTSFFAEALFPVTSALELTVAARHDRYSDYGSDTSPKVGVRFQPIDSLTLRASYGRGFAAPNLAILTQQPSFSADGVFDLPTCAALGNPGCVNPQQVDVTVIANPELSSETSQQWSVGVVWDAADWVNASVDFYNIKVEDAITAFSLSDLQTLEELGAPFPPGLGFTRSPISGAIENARRGFGNLGFEETQGVDLNINTNFDLGDFGTLTNQLQTAFVRKYEQQGVDGSVFDFAGLIGQPKRRATLQNQYRYGDFSFGTQTNYIASQENSTGTVRVGSWVTHDLQFTWSTPWNGRISLGVDNVADKLPQLVTVGGRNYNRALYDAYGRIPYLRVTQNF
jgi:iron complex outermembrane receptor protein